MAVVVVVLVPHGLDASEESAEDATEEAPEEVMEDDREKFILQGLEGGM